MGCGAVSQSSCLYYLTVFTGTEKWRVKNAQIRVLSEYLVLGVFAFEFVEPFFCDHSYNKGFLIGLTRCALF